MRKLTLTALLLVTACKVGPDFESVKLDLPASWNVARNESTPAPAPAPIPLDWWKSFNDPTLTALEEEGQRANDDIALAAARVAEARGVLRITESNLYPSLVVQGNATRTGVSAERNFGGIGRIAPKPYNDFGLAAVLDYELDLWGRIRRATEADRALLLAEKANADAVRLAVASDIATGYFNLLALDAQIHITEQTIQSRRGSVGYQSKQFEVGVIDSLTLRQAEAELAVAEAVLPSLQQAQLEQHHALSILLGRSPDAILNQSIAREAGIDTLPTPPVMPTDAPSTLLERRPDIFYSEQQLVAANAQIGVAYADYFPRFSLSALLGLNSSETNRLFRESAKNWNFGANFVGPVIDSGTIAGNVDAARARTDQARANYRQTVRLAFTDVSNALTAIQTNQARLEAQTRQVKARADTMRVSGLRYEAGYSTHLELLDAQRFLYQAQLDRIEAMRDCLSATVTLYKALGGGWNPQPLAKNSAPLANTPATAPATPPDMASKPLPETLPFAHRT